jgi:Zinc-binding dehydrogenase
MIGAHVIAGAATEEKSSFVRAQGADQAIDYTAEEWRKTLAAMTGGRPMDVVFDAGRRAAPPMSRPPAEPASPRSSNLRLARQFTDRDYDKSKHESFEFIAKFFENSLGELEQRNSGIETAFRQIDANRFTAAIYRNGKVISRCTIFVGGLAGGIAYYAGESTSGDTLNESMSVGSDEHELHLKCLGMQRGGARNLSQEGAAEYYWSLLIERLQGG